MATQETLFGAPPPPPTEPSRPAPDAPLAEKLRPRSLDVVAGPPHLLGLGKPLRVAFDNARAHPAWARPHWRG